MSTRSTVAFLKTETGAGLLLVAVAALALAWANSPWAGAYAAITRELVPVRVGPFFEEMSFGGWVRTGLMPIFFFVMGLEIKHEVVRGELSNPRRLALPILGGIGGVLGPALVYVALNLGSGRLDGWPTAVPTDVAVALAALAVAGPRMPQTLRVFLLTMAMAAHLVTVILIAMLFTDGLRFPMLAGAAITTAVLVAMARWRTAPYAFWAVGGLLLWGFTLKSGVDTSLAGIAAAFCLPLEPKRVGGQGVLAETMAALHPYVAFFILPLFVFTTAGIRIEPALIGPVSLGVAAALFLGKQTGVFGATALTLALKWARRPTGTRWIELYGASALCGIGFTLSFYIGGLAVPAGDAAAQAQIRAGVILGSVASAALGVAVLLASAARRARENETYV
ncbi:MAG: Na+/H+ antiporter NhaA [Pseudomonadota bacterium]